MSDLTLMIFYVIPSGNDSPCQTVPLVAMSHVKLSGDGVHVRLPGDGVPCQNVVAVSISDHSVTASLSER